MSDGYTGWALLELFGHRQIAGETSEAEMFGGKWCRIDVYAGPGPQQPVTQFYSASAIYCLTPTTEDLARAFAANHRPAPISRYELPAARDIREPEVDEGSVLADAGPF